MNGEMLEDRFVLHRLAGRGGMGDVYEALDQKTGAPVAVKLLQGRRHADLQRFAREVRILEALDDPRVVRHVAHGLTPDGHPYLVMEWLDGEDLAARLARGPLGAAEAVALCSEVARALGLLHDQGIVHRDLKPGNVFLVGGRPDRVKLLDFGIAWTDAGTRMTAAGALVGTAGYMAPEQAKAETAVDARSDVFALGCVLFECLAGEAAFRGEQWLALLTKILFEATPRLRDLCPSTPPPLGELLDRMLSKDPAARPADGRATLAALAALPELPSDPLPRAAPITETPALTDSEQRALAVILVSPPRDGEEGPLSAKAHEHGAVSERLLDGSVAVLLWSAQVATDLAAQAAACALAMARLAAGSRVALAMGKSEFRERVATGQAIDRAARLVGDPPRGALPAGSIALDDVAAGLLDARFDVRRLPGGAVLIGERDLGDERTLLGRVTPCVGRERELRSLIGHYEDCTSETGGALVALVTAPPGLGKSRLGRELLRQIRPKPAVWIARGEPVSAGSPFALLARLVQSAVGLRGSEPPDRRREALHRRASDPTVAAFLGELIGASFPDDHCLPLRAARQDPQLMSDRIRESAVALIAGACAYGPLVLLLEDLHWADTATVQVLDRALAELEDLPLYVLALARPEVHEAFPGLWSQRLVQELRLRELPRRSSEQLVRHVLPDAGDEAVDRLVLLSEGNAFYLEELIRAMAEGGGDLPETVVAMVQSRLGALSGEDRRLLRAASVFGETFWSGGLKALIGDRTHVSERLEGLADQEILIRRTGARFPDEQEYSFRHALLREGAYALLTEADCSLGHRLAGQWLEAQGEDDPLLLAEHFERGGDGERGGALYLRAAERAGLAGDAASAIVMARRGLSLPVAPDVRVRLLGTSCQLHYHRIEVLDEALPHAEELLETASEGSAHWAQAMLVRITAAVKAGRMDVFADALQRVMRATFEPAAADPASLTLATICYILDLGGAREPANAAFDRFEAVARDAAARAPSVTVLHHLYAALRRPYAQEDPWGAREQARIALGIAQDIGHRKYATMAVLFGALDDWYLGVHEPAREAALGVDAFADESGFASATRPFMLAWSFAEAGHMDEARSWAERLVEAGRSRSLPLDLARGQWVLAEVLRRSGELAAAEAEIGEALTMLRAVCPLDVPGALATQARLWLAQGRPSDGLSAAEEGMALTRASGTCSQFFRGAFLRLAHIDALRAAQAPAAEVALATAAAEAWLLAVADRIGEPATRARFLEEVPDNLGILLTRRE